MSRLALPVAVLLFGLLALVLPIVRLRRREGVWAITALRSRDPVERVVGALLFLAVGGYAVWSGLYAALGPGPLGVTVLPGTAGASVAAAGWAMMAAGLATVVVAQAQMGAAWRIGIEAPAAGLVTRGLFRWVRHPIYSAMLAMVAGVLLVTPSPGSLALAAATAVTIAAQARREEAHLRGAFGADFDAWAARTGRFLPGIGRLRPPGPR